MITRTSDCKAVLAKVNFLVEELTFDTSNPFKNLDDSKQTSASARDWKQ
jgi:hypothetical protein